MSYSELLGSFSFLVTFDSNEMVEQANFEEVALLMGYWFMDDEDGDLAHPSLGSKS